MNDNDGIEEDFDVDVPQPAPPAKAKPLVELKQNPSPFITYKEPKASKPLSFSDVILAQPPQAYNKMVKPENFEAFGYYINTSKKNSPNKEPMDREPEADGVDYLKQLALNAKEKTGIDVNITTVESLVAKGFFIMPGSSLHNVHLAHPGDICIPVVMKTNKTDGFWRLIPSSECFDISVFNDKLPKDWIVDNDPMAAAPEKKPKIINDLRAANVTVFSAATYGYSNSISACVAHATGNMARKQGIGYFVFRKKGKFVCIGSKYGGGKVIESTVAASPIPLP